MALPVVSKIFFKISIFSDIFCNITLRFPLLKLGFFVPYMRET